MNRRRIAIFFGGCSAEYRISLESAYAVIRSLDPERYEPVLVGITERGGWLHYAGDIERIRQDTWQTDPTCVPAVLSPDRGDHRLLLLRKDRPVSAIPLDAAFPILHGKNGEDGTIQGLIELSGIPLIGCGVLASAICMDKERAHTLVRAAGMAVPEALTVDCRGSGEAIRRFADGIGYPLFVKPVRAGSSYGVSKVGKREDLQAAVELAFRYDDRVMIEEAIDGFEVGCAILGREELTVGAVDEVELAGGFFDYTEKYTLQTSTIHVPARIDRDTAAEIQETAKSIYRALGCSGFARVDMFLTPHGQIVFNEVNTIPGFTEHSRYPGMMRAAGIPFADVLDRVIRSAVDV